MVEKLTILVIEDDEDDVLLIDKFLFDSGHKMIHSTGGNLEKIDSVIQNEGVRAVVLDYFLGGRSETGICQRFVDILNLLKSRYPKVPVVILTGIAEPEILDEKISFGLENIITKPYFDDVLKRLDVLLN